MRSLIASVAASSNGQAHPHRYEFAPATFDWTVLALVHVDVVGPNAGTEQWPTG